MFLLFDIGGTKMRVGYSNNGKDIANYKVFETPKEYREGINVIGKYILEENFKPWKVCGGLPGVIKDESDLIFATNLQEWVGKPIRTELERVCGCRVVLNNDAALAGLGEATFGSAIKYSIVAYITISTGIGGVRIVDKKIDKNSLGFEPGHQIINYSGKQEMISDWGELVSGSAIVKRYNTTPEELIDVSIWENILDTLAIGLINVIVFWSPEVIVLGGGMLDSKYMEIGSINMKIHEFFKDYPLKPPIIKYTLGEKAGLYGALSFLKSQSYAGG